MGALPFCIPSLTDPITVENWSKGMRLQFNTEEELNRYAIVEVIWGKENDIIGHEFLVVKTITGHVLLIERSTRNENVRDIIDSDDPVDALFGTGFTGGAAEKRSIEQEVKRELESKFIAMKERDSRSLFASSSDSSKEKKFIAVDSVSNVEHIDWYTLPPHKGKGNKGAKFKLFTYTFPQSNNPFTLRDIGVIANAVHQSEKAYSWKTRNCYWFAKVMMKIIQHIADPTKEQHEGADWAGRAGPNYAMSISPGTKRPDSPDVNALIEEVRRAIDEDNDKISQNSKQASQAMRSTELEAQLQQKMDSEANLLQENEALRRMIAQMNQGIVPGTATSSIPMATRVNVMA